MERLRVENVKNGDTVCHPLLLLSGKLRTVRSGCTVIARVSTTAKRSSWPVIGGAFKVLVFLKPGENIISLECATYRTTLKVKYRPMETSYFVRLVYIVCRDDDGRFQAPEQEDSSVASACSRLRLAAHMIQCLTAEKIRDWLSERRTFKLEEDNRGKVVCHIFNSKLSREEVHAMNGEELWDHFAVELMQSELNGGAECKFLAFLSATEYRCPPGGDCPASHSESLECTKGYVALGGGGLALFGTGCLHTWARSLDEVNRRLTDKRKVDKTKFMDDSCNRGQHWACYSTGLGATLHELAHTFDLGHTWEGIMGLGFHDLFKVFTPFPGRASCNCFNSNLKTREPNHYKISLIHNIEWGTVKCNERETQLLNEEQEALPDTQNASGQRCCACRLGASWTRSCAVMLYYHKWFNPCLMNGNISTPPKIIGTEVVSDVGIRVIEIRDADGMLLAHQEYLEGDGKSVASLTDVAVHESYGDVLVVAEDSEGNIIKKTIHLN